MSKGSVRQSILSGGGNGKAADNANLVNQANKTHQQSMQKFLQQQMTMYNIAQNQQQKAAAFSGSQPKAAKKVPGLVGLAGAPQSK